MLTDARRTAVLSVVVRPKCGQRSPIAKPCWEASDRQAHLDTRPAIPKQLPLFEAGRSCGQPGTAIPAKPTAAVVTEPTHSQGMSHSRTFPVLPTGADLAVEDQNQGGAPAAQRGRRTLIVIFARR